MIERVTELAPRWRVLSLGSLAARSTKAPLPTHLAACAHFAGNEYDASAPRPTPVSINHCAADEAVLLDGCCDELGQLGCCCSIGAAGASGGAPTTRPLPTRPPRRERSSPIATQSPAHAPLATPPPRPSLVHLSATGVGRAQCVPTSSLHSRWLEINRCKGATAEHGPAGATCQVG